ncbi:MAG: hypothetical protein RRC07_09410, partial [Anaerolineae bacterium]|nr:hypothetical protein [Anaerolineae bacterium]
MRIRYLWWALVLILLAAGALLHSRAWEYDSEGYDIYYAWVEGQRLLAGQNPFARILQGNMLENNKYATYFPLFYLLAAATEWLGLRDYEVWIGFWQPVFLLFHLASGAWLAVLFARQRRFLLGLIVLALWLLSNWALELTYVINFDAIPIFFLVVSLTLLPRRPLLALFSFSLSLALKQIAIFLVPLYLIWLWQEGDGGRPKRVLWGATAIASLPVLVSLPFLLWNAEGFVRSILFSATRYAGLGLNVALALGSGGFLSRLPLVALVGAVYLMAWCRQMGRFTAAMLTMLGFISLNPVLFPQYVPWFLALLLLALLEVGTPQPASP